MIAQNAAVARCHWHALMESVGVCSVCGLPGCDTCLVQEADGYRCQDCIRKGRKSRRQSPLPPPGKPRPAIWSDPKILLSSFLLVCGIGFVSFLAALFESQLNTWTVFLALLGGYVPWSLFWGALTIWSFLKRAMELSMLGCTVLGGSFWLVPVAWFLYSVFGGGIYQFLKHISALTKVEA